MGCAAAGWIAAFAEWLFDLAATIQDSKDNVLYANRCPGKDFQVRILFETESASGSKFEIVSKTCYIKDCSEIFRRYGRAEDYVVVVYSGRLQWQSCLKSSFGIDFERLMSIAVNFGIAFGSAARIYGSR